MGDVSQSLREYYSESVAAVARESGVSERLIRDWFEHHLITEQGIRGQVLMAPEQSEGLDNRAIRLLENAHLVRAEKRRGATWFELAHDRLIRPVRSSNDAWYQANLSLLQRQAALWEKNDHPEHLLLREAALEQAQAWASAHPDELSPADQEFLERLPGSPPARAGKACPAGTGCQDRRTGALSPQAAPAPGFCQPCPGSRRYLRRLCLLHRKPGSPASATVTPAWQRLPSRLRTLAFANAGTAQANAATADAAKATAINDRAAAIEAQFAAQNSAREADVQRSAAEGCPRHCPG